MSLLLSSCASRGTNVVTPGNYQKPKKSGGLTAALKGGSGYITHAQAEVGQKFQVHLFLRTHGSIDPGFYILEGYVDGEAAGRALFDYNGFGWFRAVTFHLPKEVYWNHFGFKPGGVGAYQMGATPVVVSFAILGPIPGTRKVAYAEVFVHLTCKSCQV